MRAAGLQLTAVTRTAVIPTPQPRARGLPLRTHPNTIPKQHQHSCKTEQLEITQGRISCLEAVDVILPMQAGNSCPKTAFGILPPVCPNPSGPSRSAARAPGNRASSVTNRPALPNIGKEQSPRPNSRQRYCLPLQHSASPIVVMDTRANAEA